MTHNSTVLLAMADCQAKTDKSTEIILSCTAKTRQPQAIEAYKVVCSYFIPNHYFQLFQVVC